MARVARHGLDSHAVGMIGSSLLVALPQVAVLSAELGLRGGQQKRGLGDLRRGNDTDSCPHSAPPTPPTVQLAC